MKKLCDDKNIDLTIMLIPDLHMKIPYEEEFKHFFEGHRINYFKAMIPRDGYFMTDGHWNSKGHLLASEIIIQHIKDNELLVPESGSKILKKQE